MKNDKIFMQFFPDYVENKYPPFDFFWNVLNFLFFIWHNYNIKYKVYNTIYGGVGAMIEAIEKERN